MDVNKVLLPEAQAVLSLIKSRGGISHLTSFLIKTLGSLLRAFSPTFHSDVSLAAGESSGDDDVEAFWNHLFLWPPLALSRSLVRSVLCRQSRGNAEW